MKAYYRTVNVKRNIIYGLLQVVASQLLPFIVRTVFIYRLGIDYLGLNSLFTSILSMLSLMELGFGSAIVFSMYKPVAENDIKQICGFLSYYKQVYRVVGVVILAIGLILLPFLRYFVNDTIIPGNLNLQICYLVFLSDSVISYLMYGYMTAIPIAFQRRDILNRINICVSILKCLFQIIILVAIPLYYLYLLVLPLTTIIQNIICRVVIKKRYPAIECKGSIDSGQKRELKKHVYGILITKLTGVSRNSIDSICISAFIGLAVTGIYNNYFFVISGIIAFSKMISDSMRASVGNSIAKENIEKNYNDMRLFDFVYTSLAGWAAVCLLCLFQPFIHTWLGSSMMLDMSVVVVICFYFYILKSGDIRWVYQEGAGQWYECRFIMIGEAVTNIILNILLCKVWGVFGIILVTVISVFVTNMFFCPRVLFNQYFRNGKLKEYWTDHLLYTITMLLTAITSLLICEWLLPMRDAGVIEGVICLLGRLVICTALSAVIFWLIWHRSERYHTAVDWLKRLRKV